MEVPGIGTQTSRLVFSHQRQQLLLLDTYCRSINQYKICYNPTIHNNNMQLIQDKIQSKINKIPVLTST